MIASVLTTVLFELPLMRLVGIPVLGTQRFNTAEEAYVYEEQFLERASVAKFDRLVGVTPYTQIAAE